jgi:hypothetical protein
MMRREFNSIVIRSKRQFQAFTGITIELFDELVIDFTRALKDQQNKSYQKNRDQRKRRPGGGRKGALPTPEIKLFFLLFYLKNYPTFDVLGGLFDLSLSNAKENIDKLLPILIRVEKTKKALPHRHLIPRMRSQLTSGKEEKILEIQHVDIDVTERRCQRPQHATKQKNYYSGKKKTHTLKNTIISDRDQVGLIAVGPTSAGHHHDYALFKKELAPDCPGLPLVDASFDLGYQGVKNDYPNFHTIHIPHKKPRKSKQCPNPKLTPQQKKENRSVSRLRIGVEHVIGNLKFFQILVAQLRSHTIEMADRVILAVAGLCNLKNSYVVQ